MKKMLLICFLALLLSSSKESAADWLLVPGLSHHVNTSTKHNERNWGLGYEWQSSSGRNWQIGAYDNSYWKPTTFVMTELTNYQFSDTLRFRLNGGLVTGYKYTVTPMVLPVWTYEGKKYGFDALTIPAVRGHMGIYAIQFKVRF